MDDMSLTPTHDFFIGVDSDGCAIDQMNIKHYECFTPAYIKAFNLQAISTIVRETAIYMNLFSIHRGINRWSGLDLLFDLLKQRPEVVNSGVLLPQGRDLHAFVTSGLPLSAASLTQWAAQHPSAELDQCLVWNDLVNQLVAWMVHHCAPFPGVRAALALAHAEADTMVVSAASLEMLHREWTEHDLEQFMDVIAGQEMGTKAEQLKAATIGRYCPDHVLMVGDAPADGHAALSQGFLWFPICPGEEAASWKEFRTVGLPRFVEGTFAGTYQDDLIQHFNQLLPTLPPWRTLTQ